MLLKHNSPPHPLTDNQLFYTGPSRQYMRLVIMSEEQKLAVLQESHCNPTTGNHNGVRRTRDRVISGYYWSTIKDDVTDWVKSILKEIMQDQFVREASDTTFSHFLSWASFPAFFYVSWL